MTKEKIVADEPSEEENLLDHQAEAWMAFAVALAHGGADTSASIIVKTADELTLAYMDRFENGLPGQQTGARSAPPPSPKPTIKGRDPKAEDD